MTSGFVFEFSGAEVITLSVTQTAPKHPFSTRYG